MSGSREALFALAQTVLDPQRNAGGEPAIVLCPNPFYQIYEGAALLAGAEPYFVNSDPARNFACDYAAVPADIWARTQLLYVCSPGNPTGAVLTLDDWRELFALSDRYGFVIASDECYSEIYFDEANPPLGGLEAAHQLGPRLRAARDAVEPVQALERAGHALGLRRRRRGDSQGVPAVPHVPRRGACRPVFQSGQHRRLERRNARAREPREVPAKVHHRHADARRSARRAPAGRRVLPVGERLAHRPHGHRVRRSACYADYNVTVLPGSFLARTAHGVNPGRNFVRIALVADVDECSRARSESSIFAARSPLSRAIECSELPAHRTPSSDFNSSESTHMSQQLQQIIDTAWENRAELSPKAAPADVRDAVAHAIEQLDKGALRVAEKKDGDWVVNQWLKKAVLLSFRLEDNAPMPAGGYSPVLRQGAVEVRQLHR